MNLQINKSSISAITSDRSSKRPLRWRGSIDIYKRLLLNIQFKFHLEESIFEGLFEPISIIFIVREIFFMIILYFFLIKIMPKKNKGKIIFMNN